MTETQAVVISEPGQVGLQAVSLKAPGPADVVIETAYTSISAGTERMLLAGQMPHPMLSLPVVPGYETVGRVVEVGAEADPNLKGQWVYVGGAQCYDGVNAAWGGQAARLFTAGQRVVPLEGVEPRQGVMLALAATALHGVDLLAPNEGDRVLVLGQGPVGQLAARITAAHGAWVAVTDRNPSRLARAEADVRVNVDEDTLQDTITEPVNVIVEASGSMQALSEALALLAPGGTILLLGYYQNLDLPYMPLFLKEARLLTAKEWAPGDLARCRDMITAGTLDVSTQLTHEHPIQDVARAYDVAMNDSECLKVVLNWHMGRTE
jgi:3-hydroxyethyl bacteriochlorophyllide a dehydrogenase